MDCLFSRADILASAAPRENNCRFISRYGAVYVLKSNLAYIVLAVVAVET